MAKLPIHLETSQLICSANQLTGFYMMTTLPFNWLKKQPKPLHCHNVMLYFITDIPLSGFKVPTILHQCFPLSKKKPYEKTNPRLIYMNVKTSLPLISTHKQILITLELEHLCFRISLIRQRYDLNVSLHFHYQTSKQLARGRYKLVEVQ